jgi:hypothetical protein
MVLDCSWLRGEVIISEIMFNPAGPDQGTAPTPYNREWVELYNNGAHAMNLSGWQLGDSQGNRYGDPFPAGTSLLPRQALVVTGDAAAFDAQWGSGIKRVQVGNLPVYDNTPTATNGSVALRDSSGAFRDRVIFDAASAWPRIGEEQGQSIFVLPRGLDGGGNNVATNWLPSAWGAHGARFSSLGGENHASPGVVSIVTQAPFQPSPDAAWSMVVLPDTQNYVRSKVDREIFMQQTQWIRDHRDAFRIQAVLQEGDIVNDHPSVAQWQNAQASMAVLNGEVPYIITTGNHDYDNRQFPVRTTSFNEYFKASDNRLVDPARGGILTGTMVSGELQNAYYDFTAPDGRKMLVMALEWEPRPATLAWANEVASRPEFADHTAVLLTHAYLFNNNLRYVRPALDSSGEQVWQQLVKGHENFEMTFNGHFGGDGEGYLASTGDQGNVVHQMLLDTQHETYGGGGWLRVLEFLADGTTVRVRTYSPFYELVRDAPSFQFEFKLSPLPPRLAGDYNFDGTVDVADYTCWRNSVGRQVARFNAADGNGNGIVDSGDYKVWRTSYRQGRRTSLASSIVPEPAGIVLVASMLGTFVTGWLFRRKI